jgi:lipoate-protein ligase A
MIVRRRGAHIIMDDWRLIITKEIIDSASQFSLLEAMLRKISDGASPNTIWLRRIKSSVSIGVYQNLEEEVNLQYCHENALPVLRRPTPGGALYHDPGGVLCSVAFQKNTIWKHLDIKDPDELYRIIGAAVVATCASYGVTAEITPVNDICVNGKKIYGSAQMEWYDVFLHGGSFLVSTSIDVMQDVLHPLAVKFFGKAVTNVKERVTTLYEVTGRDINPYEVMTRLAQQTAHILNIEVATGKFSEEEHKLGQELYTIKYSKPEWTFPTKRVYSKVVSTKAASGVVTLSLNLTGDVITEASLHGDFLIACQEKINRLMKNFKNVQLDKAIELIPHVHLPNDLQEALLRLLNGIKTETIKRQKK